MVRIVGFGLLALVLLPAMVMFPPLLVLTLGVVGWGMWSSRRRRGAAVAGGILPRHRPATPGTVGSPWQAPTSRTVRPRRSGRGWNGLLMVTGVIVMTWVAVYLAREAPLAMAAFLLYWLVVGMRAVGRGARRLAASVRNPLRPITPIPLAIDDLPVAVLTALGYRQIQRLPRTSSEMDMDFFARDEHQHTVLVRWRALPAGERVTVVTIAQLIDAVATQRAASGVVITSGAFTPAAINLALHSQVPVSLYDGAAIASIVAPSAISPAA